LQGEDDFNVVADLYRDILRDEGVEVRIGGGNDKKDVAPKYIGLYCIAQLDIKRRIFSNKIVPGAPEARGFRTVHLEYGLDCGVLEFYG
jgi:hypothetical protein